MSARFRLDARTWVGLASLGLVVLALLVETGRTSPGPVAAVHAREPVLAADDGCVSCHGGGPVGMDKACTSCHGAIRTQIAGRSGLHGDLQPDLAARCADCHGEHHGGDFALVSARSFAQAGIDDPREYDHRHVDFALSGRHEQLVCARCHEHAETPVLPPGKARFLGLDQRCDSCHDDPHEGRYGERCASCHGQQQPFPEIAGFAHTELCPLVGSHAEVSCVECHADGSEHSVARLVERRVSEAAGVLGDRSCRACHESPHDPAFEQGIVALLGPGPDGSTCGRCHAPGRRSFAGRPEGLVADWHGATGFPLDAPHDGAGCLDCHDGAGRRRPSARAEVALARFEAARPAPPREPAGPIPSAREGAATHESAGAGEREAGPVGDRPPGLALTVDAPSPGASAEAADGLTVPVDLRPPVVPEGPAFELRYPGRSADACDACHLDPHAGSLAEIGGRSRACLDCHDRHAFRPSRFDAADHDQTAFPLVGEHADAACDACHEVPEGQPPFDDEGHLTRVFTGTASACASCHADSHRPAFLQAVADARPGQQTCAACHSPEHDGFLGDRGAMSPDLHAASGFPLTRPHAEVACVDCHADLGRERPADGSPPPPARSPDACAVCHEDPHDGQFAEGPFGGQGCLACHARERFQPSLVGIDEHAVTAFPLTGSHAAVACVACHEPPSGPVRAAPLARRFAGTPTACEACHEDVHAGVFERPGLPAVVDAGTGCARCHDTTTFDRAGQDFDHERWTGYPLQGAHALARCDGCHVEDVAGVRSFGKVRGTRCDDCHADPHVAQFRDAVGTDCARCHAVADSFTRLVFDHQRDSRFALDATHASLECAACHRPEALPGGGTAVRYRPLGTRCADCHATPSGPVPGPEDHR